MTAYEAAIQDERDAVVRRRRQHIQAQEDEDFRQAHREGAVARIVERHSQVDQPPPSSPSPASTSPPPSSSSSSSNSDSDSNSPHDSRPKRGVRRTQKLIDNSQTAKEVTAAKGGEREGQGTHKATAREEGIGGGSRDGYMSPPSSAVLLEK
jgi:hypothetical protein